MWGEICGRRNCGTQYSANIGCTSWGKCRRALWFATQQPNISCHYNELHHADVSLLLNKNAASQFGFVQSGDGHGAFGIQSGKFLTSPCVSQSTKWQYTVCWCITFCHNWHCSVSCVDVDEQITILRAMVDYHRHTPIRFRQYQPQSDTDYIHITGDVDGCWSPVGRRGGVSNRVQGVV